MNTNQAAAPETLRLITATTASDSKMDQALLKMEEVKSRIKGDPKCGRANCFGRGWTGYQIGIDSKDEIHIFIQACRCAQPSETEYSRLVKHTEDVATALGILLGKKLEEERLKIIDQIQLSASDITSDSSRNFITLHHREIGWRIWNGWQSAKESVKRLFAKKAQTISAQETIELRNDLVDFQVQAEARKVGI